MGNKKSIFENLALLSYLGVAMIVPIALTLFAGRWLDEKLGTGPLFLFIFVVIGTLAAFRNLYKIGTRDLPKRKGRDE